jgi:hypothetical protein
MSTRLEIHAPFGAKISTVRNLCAADFPAAALDHVPIYSSVTLPDEAALVIMREGKEIILSRIVKLKEEDVTDPSGTTVNAG